MNCALTVSEIAKEEERLRRARELVKEWGECDRWLMKVATLPMTRAERELLSRELYGGAAGCGKTLKKKRKVRR